MKANNSIKKPGWELIGKYVFREASQAETRRVEAWATATEQNLKELEQIKFLVQKTNELYQQKNFDTNLAWSKVKKRIKHESSISRFSGIKIKAASFFFKYAASILLFILLGISGYYIIRENSGYSSYTEIVSGEKQVINDHILPDGSVVTLNENSHLLFPARFKKNQREVRITGEVFFDVTHDPNNPFIIDAGTVQIKVLGTSFNVNAYPESDSVEITVESGTVQIIYSEQKDPGIPSKHLLSTGEKGILSIYDGKFRKTMKADLNYLAWKTNSLHFAKTPLPEVLRYLKNTYHTEIQLKNKELENLLLTAQFEDKSPEFILNVIRLTFDLELTNENGIWFFSSKSTRNK